MVSYTNFNLRDYNSYRINSCCSKVYFPNSEGEIIEIYKEALLKPKIILGNGNNVILSKKWYEEIFIIFNGCFDEITINNNEVTAEAGATLLQLSEVAKSYSLSGFEIFYDIPGSVGGTVVMNAGANGEEIKDLILKIRYLDISDLKIKEISADEAGFEYRNSFFQKNKNCLVLKVWFLLKKGDKKDIENKMIMTKQTRWSKQPREYPNCGSVFKRPPGMYVGPMIDELGLKGFTIGGAQISAKHSGFIINVNNATGQDILDLIQHVQNMVKERFGVDLEVEQRII